MNDIKKVQVQFDSVSEIVGSSQYGIILLKDVEGRRQFTIICDRAMAVQIELHAKQLPITSIMLPDVFCRIIKESCGVELEIVVTGLVDGHYSTVLRNSNTQETFAIRASDAVLAHVSGGIPMYVEEKLMTKQSVDYVSSKTNSVAIPNNTLSSDMLKDALDKAILEENYEFATLLQNEQRRRLKKEND